MAVELSENRLQSLVIELCRHLNLKVHHCRPARRADGTWSTPIQGDPGFVDLVIVGSRILYRELKSDTGRLSAEQQRWIVELHAAGADAAVWRPGDWPDLVNAELRAIRRHR